MGLGTAGDHDHLGHHLAGAEGTLAVLVCVDADTLRGQVFSDAEPHLDDHAFFGDAIGDGIAVLMPVRELEAALLPPEADAADEGPVGLREHRLARLPADFVRHRAVHGGLTLFAEVVADERGGGAPENESAHDGGDGSNGYRFHLFVFLSG